MDINWTSLLTGVAGGIIPAAVAYYMGKRNVEASLQVNRDKIEADKESLKLQLAQKEKELAAQFKMETEKLHSDDIKRVCNDFLSCTNPMLFPNNLFDFDTMVRCTSPLYLYCTENYFSYFDNLEKFIIARSLTTFGEHFERICGQQLVLREQIKRYEFQNVSPEISSEQVYNIEGCNQELYRYERHEEIMNAIMESYTQHYEKALEAAKKLIWNEPIEKAQPLQLEDLPDEDDI